MIPGDPMYLVGIGISNAAMSASVMYSFVLGFAALLLLRSGRDEVERVFG